MSVDVRLSTGLCRRCCFTAALLLLIAIPRELVEGGRRRHNSRRQLFDDSFLNEPETEISYQPAFHHAQNAHVHVTAGKNAYLHCAVRNRTIDTKVAWTRYKDGILLTVNGQSIADPNKYFVSYVDQDQDFRLVIKNTNINDTGAYQCEMSAQSHPRRLVNLTVTENRGEIKGTTMVNSGGTILITCNISLAPPNHDLPVSLVWFHNDNIIPSPEDRERVEKTVRNSSKYWQETLEIYDVIVNDTGTYRCAPSPDSLGGKTLSIDVTVSPTLIKDAKRRQSQSLDQNNASGSLKSINLLLVGLIVSVIAQGTTCMLNDLALVKSCCFGWTPYGSIRYQQTKETIEITRAVEIL